MADQKKNPTRITIGSLESPVIASYPHVFRPHAMQEGAPEKYSCAFLIDKDDETTLKRIKRAVDAAIEKGKETKWHNKVPKNLKLPLRDGDEDRDAPEYRNRYFINASSNSRPEVVDQNVERITDPDEFYPGVLCRATVNFFPYDTAGNRGIGVGLGNIQKLREGENFTGRTRAEDDFDAVETDDDYDDEENPF